MAVIGRVSELWRYPVSSLGGERVAVLAVEAAGVPGERGYGVVALDDGKIAAPGMDRRWEPLPGVKARSAEGRIELSTDGKRWVAVPSPEADRALSDRLGFAAAVHPYADGPLPEGYDGPRAVNRYRPSALHLVTTASLGRLKALHPAGDADARRFRPNILIEMPDAPGRFPETEWIGRALTVGEARLTVEEPCRRCGFTIMAQDELERDADVLRQLVRHNGHNMGVYCAVARPGVLRVGDPVAFA
ncbi:MAG TPA: MOSC domain-containing protein [Mesorhizobium sp.]|jgi:hypothetical protein|nr:MOSC domain-containing protein [Mesorhizobium sp.]